MISKKTWKLEILLEGQKTNKITKVHTLLKSMLKS